MAFALGDGGMCNKECVSGQTHENFPLVFRIHSYPHPQEIIHIRRAIFNIIRGQKLFWVKVSFQSLSQ